MIRHWLLPGGLALALAACGPPVEFSGAEVTRSTSDAPEGADPGKCYARDVSPAVVETVTEQVMVQPPQIAADGSVLYPGVYRTETRQAIVQERQELWFETPCERDLTPDFVASLQRALKARGLFAGPVNGRMTSRTRAAVRAFQAPRGLDSSIVSVKTARQLGLIAYAPGAGDDDPTNLPG